MTCPRCTMLLGLIAAALIAHEPQSTGVASYTSGMRSVCVPGLQLHYTRNVSEAEAERVALWLVGKGIPVRFPGPMLFDHIEAGARLDLTTSDLLRENDTTVRAVRCIAVELSGALVKGTGVVVRIHDAHGKAVTTVCPPDEIAPFFYN